MEFEDVRTEIYCLVWSGFYDQATVQERILEHVREEQEFFGDDADGAEAVDEQEIIRVVAEEFQAKRAEEQTWPAGV